MDLSNSNRSQTTNLHIPRRRGDDTGSGNLREITCPRFVRGHRALGMRPTFPGPPLLGAHTGEGDYTNGSVSLGSVERREASRGAKTVGKTVLGSQRNYLCPVNNNSTKTSRTHYLSTFDLLCNLIPVVSKSSRVFPRYPVISERRRHLNREITRYTPLVPYGNPLVVFRRIFSLQ